MELTGTEKRIQALFSELSLEDRGRTPYFEHLWTRAEATKPSRVPVSAKLAVTAAAIVLAVACSFAIWTRSITQNPLSIAALEIPTPALPQVATLVDTTSAAQLPKRIARRPRQTERAIITDAALLSSWQSPTSSLMKSPSGVSFSSLPQLNQSAKDLELFLKESNQ
jgi:hypothetical protein